MKPICVLLTSISFRMIWRNCENYGKLFCYIDSNEILLLFRMNMLCENVFIKSEIKHG